MGLKMKIGSSDIVYTIELHNNKAQLSSSSSSRSIRAHKCIGERQDGELSDKDKLNFKRAPLQLVPPTLNSRSFAPTKKSRA